MLSRSWDLNVFSGRPIVILTVSMMLAMLFYYRNMVRSCNGEILIEIVLLEEKK